MESAVRDSVDTQHASHRIFVSQASGSERICYIFCILYLWLFYAYQTGLILIY
jgi:hypothetical protein